MAACSRPALLHLPRDALRHSDVVPVPGWIDLPGLKNLNCSRANFFRTWFVDDVWNGEALKLAATPRTSRLRTCLARISQHANGTTAPFKGGGGFRESPALVRL